MDPKGTCRLPSFNLPVFKRTLYPTAYMRYRDIYFSITAQCRVLIFCDGTERERHYLIMHRISPSILTLKAFNAAD